MHHQRTHAARASTSTHRCATSRCAVLRTSAAGSVCVCGVDYTDVARRLAFWTPRLRLALHAALRVGSTLSSLFNRRVLSRHPLDQTELPSARPAADDLRDLISEDVRSVWLRLGLGLTAIGTPPLVCMHISLPLSVCLSDSPRAGATCCTLLSPSIIPAHALSAAL